MARLHLPSAPLDAGSVPMGQLRMLLVEDSPMILNFLFNSFQSDGWYGEIVSAGTEQEALLLLEDNAAFDVAIVDIQLAQGTGLGVIRKLRTSVSKGAYVIVLTNYALPLYEQAARTVGADEFLDKSKDFHRIQRFIKKRFPEQTRN
jgi:CheY-like chemotaxis protein